MLIPSLLPSLLVPFSCICWSPWCKRKQVEVSLHLVRHQNVTWPASEQHRAAEKLNVSRPRWKSLFCAVENTSQCNMQCCGLQDGCSLIFCHFLAPTDRSPPVLPHWHPAGCINHNHSHHQHDRHRHYQKVLMYLKKGLREVSKATTRSHVNLRRTLQHSDTQFLLTDNVPMVQISFLLHWMDHPHLSRKQSSLSVVENQSGCKRKSIRDCKRKPKETLPLQLLSRAPPSPSFAFSLFSGSSSQLSSSCSDPNVGANWCMSVAAKGLNLLVLRLIS